MALLTLAGDSDSDSAQGPEGEPRCGCAGCSVRATWRLALTIGRSRAGLVPLCSGHAEDVRHRRWAMQVEEDWGGALLDGQHEAHAG